MATPSMALGPDTTTMSRTNGYGHTHDHEDVISPPQTLGDDSPLSDPGDFADNILSVTGDLSHPIDNEDSILQDMDTSDLDKEEEEEDAAGEDDDEYEDATQEHATTHEGKRGSLSSESSTRSSKRKRVNDDEEDHMQANPELYGLRRSGRARPTRQLAESSDEDDDDVVDSRRKRAKASKFGTTRSSRKSTAAPSERNTSPPESDDDDVYGGARARIQAKKHRRKPRSSSSGDGTPLLGEVRFSTRRTAKVTNYNEDDQDDNEEDDDDTTSNNQQKPNGGDTNVVGIADVLNHRLKEGAVLGSDEHTDYQFLIRWNNEAHYHATWEEWDDLSSQNGWRKRDNYFKKEVSKEIEAYDPGTAKDIREQFLIDREAKIEEIDQYSKVERVVNRRSTTNGLEYFVKWKALAYQHATWEPVSLISEIAQVAIDAYLDRASHLPSSNKKESNPATRSSAPTELLQQPAYIKGGVLRGFQLRGLQFLIERWCRGQNAILADEMGLGKTVQTVSFCNWLFHNRDQQGPFIIVVPLSTVPAWLETFELWAPSLNVVAYVGPAPSREIIREQEMFVNGDPRRVKFNVLLTTYEYVNTDVNDLSHVKWQFLAVDEAHRLKNRDSLLYNNLQLLHAPSRLLITGTPLQNSLGELGSLMDFLMPGMVHVDPKLDLTSPDAAAKLAELQNAIRPYVIRRTKQKVESDLPPRTDRTARIQLLGIQPEVYENILTRNYAALNGKGTYRSSLINIVMELRKVSNHPFLLPNVEESVLGSAELSSDEHLKLLLQHSGKLALLDSLLNKLKEEGHRVLIFSQMVSMLDLLGDYLRLRRYQFQRLDGTVPAAARKLAIDHYNATDSQDFAFLLSTRAGGLGINLATADTVIIYDSDWNPQADLQAMARAHRIGQKKPVTVWRLVSEDTVDEDIMERANTKRLLEFVTIQRGITDTAKGLPEDMVAAGKNAVEPTTEADISRFLKKAGQKMFARSGTRKKLEELNLDAVLANAEVSTSQHEDSIGDGEDFLRSFEYTDVQLDSTKWDEIIPKDKLAAIKAEESERANQEYLESVIEENAPRKRKAAEEARDQRAAKKRARTLAAAAADYDSSDNEELSGDPARALDEKECRNLIKAFERYGSMEEMEKEVLREARLINRDVPVVKATLQQILDQAEQLLEEEKQRIKDLEEATGRPATKKDRKTVLFDFNGVKRLNAETLKERPEDLSMIRSEVSAVSTELNFRVAEASKPASYSCEWGAREDGMLLVGIARHGYGAWATIRDDLELDLSDKLFLEEHRVGNKTARTEGEDKNAKSPGAVHLVRRTAYLISVLRDKTSGGADEQAKRALDNHHRNNRKTGSANARVSTPRNTSASPLTRPVKNTDRAKDHKTGRDRHEKLSTTNGIAKQTHSREPAKSMKRRISDERRSVKSRNSRQETPDDPQGPVYWDVEACDAIFRSMYQMLLELKATKKRNFPNGDEQLTRLKYYLLRVGDRITEASASQLINCTVDDIWMNVAYFHWPKTQKKPTAEVKRGIVKMYKKMAAQRADLEAGTPAEDGAASKKKVAESSTPPGGRRPSSQAAKHSVGEIRAEALPSFQRRPREERADNVGTNNPYRDRRDERRPRDNRDNRRSRSRSRSPRREPPRGAHRAANHNAGDSRRSGGWGSERPPSSGSTAQEYRDRRQDHYHRGSERPSSSQLSEQARREHRPGHNDDRKDHHRGHPARREDRRDDRRDDRRTGHGIQRVTDARREQRRSSSMSSTSSNRHDPRRRNGVDSYRPTHRS